MMDLTDTYRLKKDVYAREGYLAVTCDTVWFDDDARGSFVPLAESLVALRNGEIRL